MNALWDSRSARPLYSVRSHQVQSSPTRGTRSSRPPNTSRILAVQSQIPAARILAGAEAFPLPTWRLPADAETPPSKPLAEVPLMLAGSY